MKTLSRILTLFMLLTLILSTAACGKKETAQTAASATVPAATAAPALTEAPTEAQIQITEAPEPETEPDSEDDADSQPDATEGQTSDVFDAETLTGSSWTLTGVFVNGEQQSPAVYYGSVIRQTGAYITFSNDGSFSCVLGGAGCSGDYSVSDTGINLHITTKYTAASEGEGCDENQPLSCDTAAGTISLDYNGAINVFTKN